MPLFRVENLVTNKGLWYKDDQSASNTVFDLNLSNRELPMNYDERIATSKWKSAAGELEQLKYWFTHEDLLKITPLGFKLYEIESTITSEQTTDLYSHPLFQEQGVTSRIELDINLLLH